MLKQKLSKQVKIAAWRLALSIVVISVFIFIIFGGIRHSIGMLGTIGFFLIGVCMIVSFVLWIIGIINACEINTITKDSTALIIFSIFTFWIVHLIIAISEKKKYETSNYSSANPAQSTPTKVDDSLELEKHLKDSFINGNITIDEYRKKLSEIRGLEE